MLNLRCLPNVINNIVNRTRERQNIVYKVREKCILVAHSLREYTRENKGCEREKINYITQNNTKGKKKGKNFLTHTVTSLYIFTSSYIDFTCQIFSSFTTRNDAKVKNSFRKDKRFQFLLPQKTTAYAR